MIPQPRICHAGMSGPDVLAYSRAYRHLGIRQRPPTHHFGEHMIGNTKHFQGLHGVAQTGIIDAHTYKLLTPSIDGYGQWLLGETPVQPPPTERSIVVGVCLTMYAHRPYPYKEVRPYPDDLASLFADGSDCSGSFHLAYRIGHHAMPKIPDPSGFNFDGYGNTDTMLQHGTRVSQPRPGDAVFYYPTYSHVGMYLGNGRVFSHGKPGDPVIIPTTGATMIRSYLP